MNDGHSQMKNWLVMTGLIFSVATGAASIGLLVFKGGSVVQQVDQLERRVNRIETQGSPPIEQHMRLDDEREIRTRERLVKVEEAVTAFQKMEVTVGRMAANLDTIGRAVDRLNYFPPASVQPKQTP